MRTSLLAGTVVLGLATAVATPVLASVGDDTVSSSQRLRTGDAVRLAAAPAAAVPPSAEVLFNDPTGSPAAQHRIADHIRRAIDATPAGGTIRMAAYSFDLPGIAELRRAL